MMPGLTSGMPAQLGLLMLYQRYAKRPVSSLVADDVVHIGKTLGMEVQPSHPIVAEVLQVLPQDSVDSVADVLAKPEVFQRIASLFSKAKADKAALEMIECRECKTHSPFDPAEGFFECNNCGRVVLLEK